MTKRPAFLTYRKPAPCQWRGEREQAISHICAELSLGGCTLEVICAEMEPRVIKTTLQNWRNEYPEWDTRIDDAFHVGIDRMALECLAIADEVPELVYGKTTRDERQEHRRSVKRASMMIRTRLELIKCWDRRYAEKRIHSGDGEHPVVFKDMSDADVESRFQELLAKQKLTGEDN